MPRLSKITPKLRCKKVGKHKYAVVTLDGKVFHLGPHNSKVPQLIGCPGLNVGFLAGVFDFKD